MYVLFLVGALGRLAVFFVLGVFALLVVLWFKGFMRFRRVRRFASNTATGATGFAKTHRLSKVQLRTVGIVLGALVALVVLNQLKLGYRPQDEGKGLSVPIDAAMTFNFEGINSPGEWIATSISYALIVGLLALVWYRFHAGVPSRIVRWRPATYWGALALFVLLPALFALIVAVAAPEVVPAASPDDPAYRASLERSVSFTENWLRFTLSGMATAFSVAAALAHVGPKDVPVPSPRSSGASRVGG